MTYVTLQTNISGFRQSRQRRNRNEFFQVTVYGMDGDSMTYEVEASNSDEAGYKGAYLAEMDGMQVSHTEVYIY